jgi:fibronectin-binding autotransporter adhesin
MRLCALGWICAAVLPFAPLRSGATENVLNFAASSHIVNTTGCVATVDFTFEAWVRMTAAQAENQIVCQYKAGDAGRMIVALQNDRPGLFIGSWLTGSAVNFTNTWTHLAVTRSGSACKIYVNGVQNASGTINANTLAPTGITIGGLSFLNTGFRGQIADVRVWSVARTQAEISAAMGSRLTGSETGLAYYWRLDEGTGILAYDHAATAANGTISGATWVTSDLPIQADITTGVWIASVGGRWSDPANWLGRVLPQGDGSVAYFTNTPPQALTVTNDLSALLLGQWRVNSPVGFTFEGNSVTMTNGLSSARVVSTNGSHTFAIPLVTTAKGLFVETASASALTLIGVVGGTGTLSVNPSTSGGGVVTLSDANTYTGATVLGCGTLSIAALANGGVASGIGASPSASGNLVLGPGTLRYTGSAVVTERGYTVAAGASPVRAATLDTEGSVTFGGQIQAISGAFIKTGPGTVTYTYPGVNTLTKNEGSYPYLQNGSASGDSPTVGFAGFNINQGTVVFGVPGQTNIVNGRIIVGLYTTTNAGAETAGELILNEGALFATSNVGVSWNNGTAVTAGAGGVRSRFTVNGGYFNCPNMSLGLNNAGLSGFNAHPILEQNGGVVELSSSLVLSESSGAVSEANLNGGTLRVLTSGNSIRVGGAGEATMTIGGAAVVDALQYVRLAEFSGSSSKGLLNLNGGTLIAANILKGSGTEAILRFNGGTFCPRMTGQTLSGLTAAYVSTNGAVFDTSLADGYTVAQNLLVDPALGGVSDGGLVKLGTNTLTWASTASTYIGPTVVSNGMLRLLAPLPASSLLSVAASGEALVGGGATQTVAVSGVALAPGGTLGFALAADGSTNDRLSVGSSPSLGSGRIALYQQGTEWPFTRNGTYTLLYYSGADPDASGLTAANPAFGKTYAFAAGGGALSVTVASSTAGASVWSVPTGGAWNDAGNWVAAPVGATGDRVRFDDAVSSPVTVATANETVGEIYFNNAQAGYTLGGSGLTLDNGDAPACLSVESGAHAVTAPLTLAGNFAIHFASTAALTLGTVDGGTSVVSAQGDGTLTLTAAPAVAALALDVPKLSTSNTLTFASPVSLARTVTLNAASNTSVTLGSSVSGSGGLTKAGSSTLVVSGANTYAGPTTLGAGTLSVSALANGGAASGVGASSASAGNLVLGPGTLRYTGAAVTTDRGYTVAAGASPVRAAILDAEGDVTFGGQIQATSGAFIKTGPGTVSYTYPGVNTLNFSAQGTSPFVLQDTGANGDGPTTGFAAYNINQGTVVMGVPGQTNNVTGRLIVGLFTTTKALAETAGELVVNEGLLSVGASFGVGWHNGTAYTAGADGLQSKVTVNGGYVKTGTISLGLNNQGLVNFNARPVFVQNGGVVDVLSGCTLVLSESSGAVSEADINGGTMNVLGAANGNSVRLGEGGTATLTIRSNAVVSAVQCVRLAVSSSSASKGYLNLDGGTLIAQNILKGSGTEAVLRFNGGVFRPSLTNQTMSGLTAAYVSTNGAAFDTSLADGYTVAQNLLTYPGLAGATDGGLVKLGTNSLSLTGAGNTFNGPVAVRQGLLRARLGGTNDLFVADAAAFDALGERVAVGDLSGTGLLTNGVIAVTGTLDAGTNGVPAGARLTVGNLSLLQGAVFACDWSTNAQGRATNDFVAVTGTLAPEGAGFIDFGRSAANPLPMPFSATVMSYGTLQGRFTGWKALRTGLPRDRVIATVIRAVNGAVTVEVRYGGTLVLLQ